MRFLAWMLMILISSWAFAQEKKLELVSEVENLRYKSAIEQFDQGKYDGTIEELNTIEKEILASQTKNKRNLGLISYWKGICYNRLQDYNQAIASFNNSIGFNYIPEDLHYELGQALFASERPEEARLQFKESLKKKYKRGVSLYYLGYISKELGQIKAAYNFFKFIDKLNEEEKKEVKQSAEIQIGDMYLDQAEKSREVFKNIEGTVIPQYELAYEVDKESSLAPIIQEKILKLQRKYDLILFNLRNGRPALNPPYFLRLAQEVGQDSNVTFSPAETTISKSKQSSLYSRTDFFGRYTFYVRDFFSIAPELRFNSSYYFNRVPEVYRNDNYFIAPSIRTSYEHSFRKKPASLLLDYDFNESRRDVDEAQKLKFSSRSHAMTLGERFNYFKSGESTVRLRHRLLQSYLADSNSITTSLIFEQINTYELITVLYYTSYDRMRVENNIYDIDSLTLRADVIFPRFQDWFSPSLGFAVTSTDPVNNRDVRGRELLLNPSLRLAKVFKKNWRGNLKYDFQKNSSNDDNFTYLKSIYAFELEYLF